MSNNVVSMRGRGNETSIRRIIPERLMKARKALRLSQTDLAALIGVTRQSVSAYEQGVKYPDGQTAVFLAEALKQPISYFTGEMPSPIGPFSVKTFRAFGAATRRRNDQCEVLAEWVSIIVGFYSEYINFPEFEHPQVQPDLDEGRYSSSAIEKIASEVRKAWGLGNGPVGDLIKLVEAKGVIVSHLPIKNERVNAFSFWSGPRPFIFMASDSTTAVRTRFDIAHELGHLILHQGVSEEDLENKATLKRIEAEANRFAGAFLLPDSAYINEVFTSRLGGFVELKKRWGVSIAAQVSRCADLEILSEDQVLNLRKQISARKWRTHEPLDDEIPNERPRMLQKAVLMLLDNNIVSKSEIRQKLSFNTELVEALSNLEPGFMYDKVCGEQVVDLKLK
ncbi:XRE family transcriptional regulator [Salinicola lusitanus]|uniref:XRE family transcriptional regulator n=1 Tax=Salinicola lusitanus TaxID=1949085 RepID=UPI000DA21751|nr:XRE family transcriptional regulator [Salinicola lusitanus]